jgi:hypothetical protein
MSDDSRKTKAQILFSKDATKKTLETNQRLSGEEEQGIFPIRKPNANLWIKVMGDTPEDLPWRMIAFIPDATNKENAFLIASGDEKVDSRLHEIFEGSIRLCVLAPCIDQHGNEFLWAVKQNTKGMNKAAAHTSALKCLEEAQQGWRKIYWKDSSVGWVHRSPVDQTSIDDQEFSKDTIEEKCFKAFQDSIIDSMDHEQVRIRRGAKL